MADYNRIRAEAQLRSERSVRRNAGRDNIKIPDFLSAVHSTPEATAPPEPPKYSEPHPMPKKHGLLNMLDFDRMDPDSDSSVILMLLAILSGRDKDTDDLLILALLYIML